MEKLLLLIVFLTSATCYAQTGTVLDTTIKQSHVKLDLVKITIHISPTDTTYELEAPQKWCSSDTVMTQWEPGLIQLKKGQFGMHSLWFNRANNKKLNRIVIRKSGFKSNQIKAK